MIKFKKMTDKLEFAHSPVTEVVFGAQFEGFVITNEIIFNYYQLVKDTYPKIQSNQPLASVIEKINLPNETRILQGVHSRQFFINNIGNKLIQIQPDRLLFNWRKTSENQSYPHFDIVFAEFNGILNQLNSVNRIVDKINQLEVTYVDQFFLDDFNKDNFDPNGILKLFAFSKPIKSIDCTISFPISELNGNLNLTLRSASNTQNQKKLLIMETTCRGINNNMTIDNWFNFAHDKLLGFFNEITTSEAKQKWGVIS